MLVPGRGVRAGGQRGWLQRRSGADAADGGREQSHKPDGCAGRVQGQDAEADARRPWNASSLSNDAALG